MKDKTCLITGTASGMGRLTAMAAAEAGMHVIGVDFDVANGQAAKEEITTKTGNVNFDFIECDISSMAQVRALAEQVNHDYEHIDILVNNAGLTESIRRESADGIEMTMATNFLGPFLLTNLLLDKLRTSTPARIINICSDAHKMAKGLDWEDIDNKKKWHKVNHGCGFQAYARSKLCLVAFSYDLAEILDGTGVSVYAVSPGYFIKTNIFKHMRGVMGLGVKLVKPFLQSVESGAKTHIWLTTTPDLDAATGHYWEHCKLKESSKFTHDNELRRKIWEYAVEVTGLGN
ncbi:MAG: SDR family NAD(P)-dependent oxidoreductase [Gammaproteobacteria bacterium]|nr:SDR family NAD(P)-dependent oxidoreductase [Gammaproteobacteria bacterium]MCP4091496.1 SDR family NAD(P)-dependent oxidoreductase [Gammaproteobacteria bacterium]MCP4275406.1 SDR family NAD(P)-dependent oxidoreductase [Gammaproteobacteria bacterium]MCP4832294.1 SDR family NAD(P)-dependent oxidoreductase [Gammaproteobacteria bacterium]MCP4928131.1 SDR family NAD(P)-dependent oxidoreductase [Gammaproteobacteria bacterium]